MPVPSYLTIPSDDDEFRATVEELIARVHDVERLRECVAKIYPNAHISIQNPLGSLPGQPMRVYIYRDGIARPAE